jgi:hypothetical protein
MIHREGEEERCHCIYIYIYIYIKEQEKQNKNEIFVQETNEHIKRKKQNSSFLVVSFIEEDEREIVACVPKKEKLNPGRTKSSMSSSPDDTFLSVFHPISAIL